MLQLINTFTSGGKNPVGPICRLLPMIQRTRQLVPDPGLNQILDEISCPGQGMYYETTTAIVNIKSYCLHVEYKN